MLAPRRDFCSSLDGTMSPYSRSHIALSHKSPAKLWTHKGERVSGRGVLLCLPM